MAVAATLSAALRSRTPWPGALATAPGYAISTGIPGRTGMMRARAYAPAAGHGATVPHTRKM